MGGDRKRRKSTSQVASHPLVLKGVGSTDSWDFDEPEHQEPQKDLTLRDELSNLVLLVVLYALQGVPLGLTMGSMPFLLQSNASYTQIGIFTVASYPYSFKLLWSPVVDSLYWAAFGRRKSWIVPMQAASAVLMVGCAGWLEQRLQESDIVSITALFLVAVMLAATQDIAVDGWALTLLSRKHVGWASTCQTVGMNLGYFSSFTVFLALNDPSFCNAWLRQPGQEADTGVVSLASYVRFWGWVYLAVTLIVAVFKAEAPQQQQQLKGPSPKQQGSSLKQQGSSPKQQQQREGVLSSPMSPDCAGQRCKAGEDDAGGEAAAAVADFEALGLSEAYTALWGVIRLPAVQQLSLVLLTCRVGMLVAEQASALKLLEKGVTKEALAGLVLVEFPCELLSAVLAGRWASGAAPSRPWLAGYRARLAASAALTALVAAFVPGEEASMASHPGRFACLAVLGLLTSFSSTLMFTSLGNFYTRISDPAMGGAYLTLLNTISNMGVILPKIGVFWLMDVLTSYKCTGGGTLQYMGHLSCPSNHAAAKADNQCTLAGGKCQVDKDGFYALSYAFIAVGAALSLWYAAVLPRLESLPQEAWRSASRLRPKQQQKQAAAVVAANGVGAAANGGGMAAAVANGGGAVERKKTR